MLDWMKRAPAYLLLNLIAATPAWSSQCSDHNVELRVLGSGGPEYGDARASTSYLVSMDGKATVLVDAGSGSSLNFEKAGAKIEDLAAIVFTHLHVDHSAALPALVKASYFTPRHANLSVYGPTGNSMMPSTSRFVQTLFGAEGAFRYLHDFIDASANGRYQIKPHDVSAEHGKQHSFALTESLSLQAVAVHHGPVAALAWRVNVLDCAISFSGDMSNRYQVLAALAKGSDILVAHNAIPEAATGVARALHMPPSEIGRIAQAAQVKKLVLSHRMLRTTGVEEETSREIAKAWAGPVSFADDLDTFKLD